MNSFYAALVALMLLDFLYIGFIPYIFKINLPYRKLIRNDVLIVDLTCNIYLHLKGVKFHSLILTKNHLILKNTKLTAIKIFEIIDIKKYQIVPVRAGRSKMKFIFDDGESRSRLTFTTEKAKLWAEWLEKLNVKVEGKAARVKVVVT